MCYMWANFITSRLSPLSGLAMTSIHQPRASLRFALGYCLSSLWG